MVPQSVARQSRVVVRSNFGALIGRAVDVATLDGFALRGLVVGGLSMLRLSVLGRDVDLPFALLPTNGPFLAMSSIKALTLSKEQPTRVDLSLTRPGPADSARRFVDIGRGTPVPSGQRHAIAGACSIRCDWTGIAGKSVLVDCYTGTTEERIAGVDYQVIQLLGTEVLIPLGLRFVRSSGLSFSNIKSIVAAPDQPAGPIDPKTIGTSGDGYDVPLRTELFT